MAQTKFQKFVHDIQPICFIITSAPKGQPPFPEELVSSHNTNFLREFFYFSCAEYSIENLMAFLTITDYQKNPTFEKAHFIKNEFFETGCKYEVNTNTSNIQAIAQRLEHYNGMHVYAKTPAPDIFDTVRKDTKTNIIDTLSRFKSSYLKRNLGAVWLYKVPVEKYIKEIPSHIALLRSAKEAGFKLPSVLDV